jgi:tetratricopeptide (TPR) repeat protein
MFPMTGNGNAQEISMTLQPLMRWLLALGLMMSLSFSWALPSPKDIEAALNAGQTAQAESMLREVLKEKPQSAKAHYELGQVLAREGRYDQALGELRQAESIDPGLKFAHSPEQFHRIVAEVKELDAKRNVTQSAPVAPAAAPMATPAHAEPAVQMSTVWWGIGLLFVVGLVLLMMRSRTPPNNTVYAPASAPVPDAPRGFGAGYNPMPGAGYPPASSGSGMTGAVVGGLAGVAAGYALAKAMEGHEHAGSSGAAQAAPSGGYVPFDQTPPTQLDAFDSGSGGDSWDSGGDAPADDSW